jgi:hypothetical protein
MDYSFACSEAESTPRVGLGHAGQVQQLSPRAAAGDDGDGVATQAEDAGDEAHERLVGASFYGRSRQSYTETTVGYTRQLVAPCSRGDPDVQAQAAARLGERPGVTT